MGLTLTRATLFFLDTAPFIYFFEENPSYVDKIAALFDQIHENGAQVTTSLITYIEITTAPARTGDTETLAKYRDYFTNSEGTSIQPINLSIADEAVRFRVKYNMKTPDSIQLATASYCGADYVLTNDKDWTRIEGLRVVMVDDL